MENIKKPTFDIDLDFADRSQLLKLITYTPARIETALGETKMHNSGVYVTPVPTDPVNGMCSFDHKKAEELGYIKLDLLNQSVYKLIKNQEHLTKLMNQPVNWDKLQDAAIIKKLIHVSNYSGLIKKLPEPIDSIEKLAMFISLVRPGKKHLQGLYWNEIRQSIWEKTDIGYFFKHSHAISYALLVTLHLKLLEEQEPDQSDTKVS